MYYKLLGILSGSNQDFQISTVNGSMWFAAKIRYRRSDVGKETSTVSILFNNVPYFRDKGTSIVVISDKEECETAIVQWNIYESAEDRQNREHFERPNFNVEIDFDENDGPFALSTDEARMLVEFVETKLNKLVYAQENDYQDVGDIL